MCSTLGNEDISDANMNKKKLFLSILIGLCLIGLGFGGGTYFGWTKFGRASRSMERLFGMAGYAQYTAMEYQYAEYAEAKKTLLQYIAVLDSQRETKDLDACDRRMYRVEAMLSHIRLALLEEKNGNTKEADKYLREASKRCQDAHWKDCSLEKIRQVVERSDHFLKQK